jgi:ferric-dicitrate binding protein FerR (iron transport regulator)
MVVLWRFFPFSSNHTDKTKFQFVATDYGQRTRIQLPEGTVIILNAKSTLRYPAVWTDATERRIDLHGEAYFEAASRPEGPQHDLIVQTNDGTVKVVGTRFVVYERGQGTRVVVEEGGVMVTVADTNASQTAPATQALLNPGHLLQFQKGSRDIAPKSVNSGIYTSWWREHLELEGAPFGQVIRRLEETYGIRIEVEDESLLQRTLSGSIENRNLEVITEALAKALSTTVRRKGQVVVFGKLAAE